MAQFDLNIRCSDIDEFSEIVGRLCGASLASYEPETTDNGERHGLTAEDMGQSQGNEPVKPKRTRKSKAGAEPTQNPDGSPIEPVKEPLPQPTPGGTEAPPAESIPPKQADVFGGGTEASTGQPAAASGDPAGAPDLNALKTAMSDLLRVKNAAFAMKTLEDATGCKSLSSGSPSVVEKAKDDPGIMQRALDALVAGKDAA